MNEKGVKLTPELLEWLGQTTIEDDLRAEIAALRTINAEHEKRAAVVKALLARAGAENPQSITLKQAWDAIRNGPSLEEHRAPRRER